MTRHRNDGLYKICGCPRRRWARCSHAWHFNFKPRGGHPYRFSLDKHVGRHLDSKSDAADVAGEIRKAIKAGRFGQATPRDEMTLRQLADTYLERYVAVERALTAQAFTWALNTICATVIPCPTGGRAPFGHWRITDIVTDTIERFREVRRGHRGPAWSASTAISDRCGRCSIGPSRSATWHRPRSSVAPKPS